MSERIDYEKELRKAEAKKARLETELVVRAAIREHEELERSKRKPESIPPLADLPQNQASLLQSMLLESLSQTAQSVPAPVPVNLAVASDSAAVRNSNVFSGTAGKPKRLEKGTEVWTTFTHYTLGGQVGEGANSNVFSAEDDKHRRVAIKFLKPEIKTSRFKNEIAFCESVNHPNIVRVIDRGIVELKDARRPFYVMPLYESTLKKRMKDGISPGQAISIFVGLLAGLKAAHEKGIIHRDIKPANVLFDKDSDVPVIADFGIAHFPPELMETSIVTESGELMANRSYAAPEQTRVGAHVGPQADVFSLGLILNEMFTGDIPKAIGFKTIRGANPDYGYLDELFEQLFQQDPDRRLFPTDRILDTLKKLAGGAGDEETVRCVLSGGLPSANPEAPVVVHSNDNNEVLVRTSQQIERILSRISLETTENQIRKKLFSDSKELFISALSSFSNETELKLSPAARMENTRPVRNLCLRLFAEAHDYAAVDAAEIADFIADVHNGIPPLTSSFDTDLLSCHLDFFFWDVFIGTTCYFLAKKDYAELRSFLCPSFPLRQSWSTEANAEWRDYTWFQTNLEFVVGKTLRKEPGYERPDQILVKHELLPHWKASSLCCADLFLSQIGEFFNRDRGKVRIWYPYSAGMSRYDSVRFWNQLRSRKACERLFPLLDVSSIQTLKDALRRTDAASIENGWCKRGAEIGGIRRIVDEIDIDEVGSMP